MNQDITLNTIVFAKSFDQKDGSERRSTARGINKPDVMNIKRQDTVNSSSKIAEKRFVARIDRTDMDSTGRKYITSAYVVIVVPEIATQAEVDNVVTTLRALVASTAPNLLSQVLNSES